jgi:hypothetical protein
MIQKLINFIIELFCKNCNIKAKAIVINNSQKIQKDGN